MADVKTYEVPAEWKTRAFIDRDKYLEMYKQSVDDPEGFWGEHGKRIDWIKPYTKVKNTSFDHDNVSIKWYEDGTLNVCANCVDRHVATKGDQPAIIWEGDDPSEHKVFTYAAPETFRVLARFSLQAHCRLRLKIHRDGGRGTARQQAGAVEG